MSTFGFIGDLLIRVGVTDADGMTRAQEHQAIDESTVGRALAELGIADEEAVAAAIASALSLEVHSATPAVVPAELATLLPLEFCVKYRTLPLAARGGVLQVAMTDPLNYSVLQDIEFRTGRRAAAVVVTQTWFEQALASLQPEPAHPASYDLLDRVDPAGEVEPSTLLEYELVDPATLAKDTRMPPIVRLVNAILSEAAKAGASDVHIEPGERSVRVRQRVDGLLRETLTIPSHLQDQTISRLKIISGMDIAERRRPQDGRCRLRFGGARIDLRVSTLPTQFGEKVVIRLLDASRAVVPLEDLALTPENLRRFRALLTRPQGLILLTGPTGSGKTSTLYSAINTIKSPTSNIVTLEDPIEFQVAGVNQMQMNVRAGVTFATALRSVLRQDPNVILVGEIRDEETASIALEAAQTGHLLLSTVHANDAPATITRLFDLGVQPFLAASSLAGVLAQRLVRRPCLACAEPHDPSPETVERLGGWTALPQGRWVAGRGCAQCGQSGFAGRLAIHELLIVDQQVRELIASRASEQAIRKAAHAAGMRSLVEDGIEKAAAGLTTLDEVLRVAALAEIDARAEEPAARAATPAAAPGESVSEPRRVLVVEDSPTIVTVVTYYLELEGFEVIAAEDGRLGLEIALRECPALIVSDVNMPGMGGLEMVKALRLNPLTADVPVLMLTSDTSVDTEAAGLASGADDYITKPVDPRRLVARIKALLARARSPRG
jgi:type IV pilus assembly protein PilB